MKATWRERWVVLALCVASGCAPFVGKSDYADYREVRLASDDDARLRAMRQYVERHPEGHYHEEVQHARAARELAVFRDGKGTRAGLERYLAAFPEGTFADQARARLSALALVEQQAQAQKAREVELAAERSKRQAELRRTWVTRFARYWGRTLLGLSSWGASIPDVAQANPVFSRAFGAEPRPRCTRDECVKHYESPYAVPVPGGTRIERSLSLVLRLRMRDGKLERAELLWPGRGFSRWFELENRTLVVDADPDARAKAVAWALDALQPLIADLGTGVGEEPSYVLGPIERPAIGSSGELVDTAAEDPTTPPNRLHAADGGETVNDLVKPQDPAAGADMVFAPMRIDESGRGHKAADVKGAQAPAAGQALGGAGANGEADAMVFAPMRIDETGRGHKPADAPSVSAGSTAPLAAAAATPSVDVAAPASVAQAIIKANRWNRLRVVRFAAASDSEGPAYDGLLIERIP